MAIYMWRTPDYLCFTAEQASSTITLNKSWSPTAVNLETSTDWDTWTDYTFGTTITLNAVGNKVYFRNKSETPTWFSTSSSVYYGFSMTWKIAASWDVNYLLCKNSTTTLVSDYCFFRLFYQCASLTTAPKLPATTLTSQCYSSMFRQCTSLETAPELPATTLATYCYVYMYEWDTALTYINNLPATTLSNSCYSNMYKWCSNIKLSTTQTWAYQTPYRIPTTWTWTEWTSSLLNMFINTWWTFTWTPTINTTYYTSNTVV